MVKPSISSASPGLTLFIPALLTSLCWYLSPNDVTPAQGVLAYLLAMIPWASYLAWRQAKRRDFPLFRDARIHALDLLRSASLLWRPACSGLRGRGITGTDHHDAPDGRRWTVCLGLGMRTRIAVWDPAKLPDLTDTPMSWPYLRVVMILGILVGLRGSNPYALGEGGRQIMMLLQTAVPSTVFAFFFRKYVRREALPIDKVLVFVFLASRVLVGLIFGLARHPGLARNHLRFDLHHGRSAPSDNDHCPCTRLRMCFSRLGKRDFETSTGAVRLKERCLSESNSGLISRFRSGPMP